MGIALLSKEEMRKILKRKLLGNWIVVFGEIKALTVFEENVYPPGTKANKGFEIIYLPTWPIRWIVIAEKTANLRKTLKGVKTFEWDNLTAIIVVLVGENQAFVEMKCLRPELAEKMKRKKKLELLDDLLEGT